MHVIDNLSGGDSPQICEVKESGSSAPICKSMRLFIVQLVACNKFQVPFLLFNSFLISLIMDEGDEVSNLWVIFTSENVAITFDGTTGYVDRGTIKRLVTTMVAERLHSVKDNSGYLLGPIPYNSGVKIEEVCDDASVEYQYWVPQILPTVVEPQGGTGLPLYPGANYYGQLVPFDSGYNYGPERVTNHVSSFEECHRSLLAVNKELNILVGDLRRDRGATERHCNEMSVLLDARDGDNFLQHQEIDCLIGENRELRAHIGALEFEITRLRRELRVGFY
nr:hypothetical protein [Tanacetum cinerariifolium]